MIKDNSQHDPAPLPNIPTPLTAAPRLHFVDGLRGLAMLSVLLFHCRQNGGEWQWTPFRPHSVNFAGALNYGYIRVNLFSVLSGFCLYWPFARPGRPEPTLLAFAQKRCRRILPPRGPSRTEHREMDSSSDRPALR